MIHCFLSAANHPQEIEDAPLDEIAIEEAEQPSSSAFSYRLFTISYINYNHLKEDIAGNSGLNQLFEKRNAVQEANAEFLYKIPGRFVFKTDILAQYSTSFSESTPLFETGYHDYVRINEFFIELFATNKLSFLAGKYRRIYTPGLFQNPLDLYNPVSALPGQQAKREGAYIAHINYFSDFELSYLSSIEITAAYLPMFYQNKYGIISEKKDFFATEQMPDGASRLTKEKISWNPRDSGGYTRFYMNLLKGDFNIIYYYLNQQSQPGISYAKYLNNYIELHAETILYEKQRHQFQPDAKKTFYADMLLGSRIEYSDYAGFTAEYIRRDEKPESLPKEAPQKMSLISALLNESRTADFLTPLRDYLVFSLYSREINDLYSITLNTIYGIYHKEVFSSLRFDIKSGDTAMFSVTAGAAAGSSESFYGGMIPFDYKLTCELLISF